MKSERNNPTGEGDPIAVSSIALKGTEPVAGPPRWYRPESLDAF